MVSLTSVQAFVLSCGANDLHYTQFDECNLQYITEAKINDHI